MILKTIISLLFAYSVPMWYSFNHVVSDKSQQATTLFKASLSEKSSDADNNLLVTSFYFSNY